ncbi:MAG: branched-chain amino acid ABC transporter permease [Firmicutes bacterium]|nr:branched-chain amino acid ABC transporter permease [Bacillota bacterium]
MLQFIANGVVVGAVVAVTAVGLTLVYSILKLTNFAHGDMVTFGAYVALLLNLSLGLDIWWTLPPAFLAGALLGVLGDRLIWSRMRRRQAGSVSFIVASIGLALALRNLIVFFFGAQTQHFRLPVEMRQPLGPLPVKLTPDEVHVIVAAVVLFAGVHALLRYTTIGRAMRAMADNPSLSWVSGVDVDRVITWTWILGGGLAAVGGVLYGMIRPIDPNMGWFLLLPMFAAIILGGIGNAYGAAVGGVLIGIIQEASVMFLPAEYRLAVGFLAMIAVLLTYPRGLFGERSLT